MKQPMLKGIKVRHPSVGVSAIGGQDDQWLRIEGAETPSLGLGPIRDTELIKNGRAW